MAHRWSPAGWATSQSPVSLLAVRLLLIANALMFAAVGGLCLAFASEPAGAAGAGLSWGAAAGLSALVPYTNPRRGEHGRW
jgi:hypothetical protein